MTAPPPPGAPLCPGQLASFALFCALPFLPYAAGRLVARFTLARPPEPARIRRARTIVGAMFFLSCVQVMALKWVAELSDHTGPVENWFRAATKGWRSLVAPLGFTEWWEVAGFIVVGYLVPLVAVFVMTMRLDQQLARALDPDRVGRSMPVGKAAALLLYLALPSALIAFAAQGITRALPEAGTAVAVLALLGVFSVVIGLFTLLSPLMLRLFNDVTPLPAGPLRDRLAALADAAGLRVRGFYRLASKEFHQANAFVTGILPGMREVHLTPVLLEHLTEEEIAAIVAHEFAHLKARHLHAYLAFSFAYFFFIFGIISLADIVASKTSLVPPDLLAALMPPLMLGAFLAYFLILFRYYSRRFEREADRIAAGITGDPEPLARGLAFVYGWNRAPERAGRFGRAFLTHDALESRLADLRAGTPPPPVSKWRLPAAILVAGIALVALDEVCVDRPRRTGDLAWRAQERNEDGRHEEAEALARRALAADPAHPGALHAAGVSLAKRGKEREGEEMIRRSAATPKPYYWAAWNLALLAWRRGDAPAALAALAGGRLRAASRATRATALFADYVLWKRQTDDILSNDSEILNIDDYAIIYYDNRTLSTELYDEGISNVNIMRGDPPGSRRPFAASRKAAALAGSRFIDAASAVETPGRFGLPPGEALRFLDAAARGRTSGVLVTRSRTTRFLPLPAPTAADGEFAPPVAALQLFGAFPLAGSLNTTEAYIFRAWEDGTRPVTLYDATR